MNTQREVRFTTSLGSSWVQRISAARHLGMILYTRMYIRHDLEAVRLNHTTVCLSVAESIWTSYTDDEDVNYYRPRFAPSNKILLRRRIESQKANIRGHSAALKSLCTITWMIQFIGRQGQFWENRFYDLNSSDHRKLKSTDSEEIVGSRE